MKKVVCDDCHNPIISNKQQRIYCPTRQRWVPERKYNRRRKCSSHMTGLVRGLPWKRNVPPIVAPTNITAPKMSKEEILAERRPVKKLNFLQRLLMKILTLCRRIY